MSDVKLELVPVSAMPVKEHRAGPVGRPSPYTEVLTQLRDHPGQAYRITAEPMELKPNRAGQVANRIRNGQISGTVGGEFDATDEDGHVYVEYLGQAGIDAYAAKAPEREARAKARAEKRAAKAAHGESTVDAHDAVAADESVTVEPTAPAGVTPAFAGADTSGW